MGDTTERGGRARAARWRWQLNSKERSAGAGAVADAGGLIAGVPAPGRGATAVAPLGAPATRAIAAVRQSAMRTIAVVKAPRHTSLAAAVRTGRRQARGQVWLLAILAVVPAILAAVDLLPATARAYPTLRAAGETVVPVLAFGAVWLLRAQFAHTRRLADLRLLGAMLTLAITSLMSGALPAALDLRGGGHFVAMSLGGALFAATGLAAAARAPADRLIVGGRPVTVVAAASLGAVAASAAAAWLPSAGTSAGTLHFYAATVLVCAAGLFTYAAAVLVVTDANDDPRVRTMLAGGAVLLAAACAAQIAFPPQSSTRFPPSEALRLVALGLLLAAAIRRELQMRRALAETAAAAERRRVARDLHDGLAQDLAFIAAHGARFAEQLGEEHPVVVAAQRALAASRGTIVTLSDPAAVTSLAALETIAYELRARFRIAIAVHVSLEEEVSPDLREQLARIAREAIANAARHGDAKTVVVSLKRRGTGLVLRVVDDGCGIFDPRRGRAPEGFGLTSMRERAASVGGQLTVRPHKRGTEIEVVLP